MNEIKTISKINGVKIEMIDSGAEKRVPIKPICQALGINEDAQRRKILSDEFLRSVTVLDTATGSDKKGYKMTTIPYKYVFGWLFSINPEKVKPEAKEAVLKYKIECYDALYDYFTSQSLFLQEKQKAMTSQQEILDQIKEDFNTAKNRLKEEQKRLKDVYAFTFEEWKDNNRQLKLF